MFQAWRMKIKEAEAALRGGRLDEASRLLDQGNLREFSPARQLSAQVAARLIERAKGLAAAGHTSAGWRDLASAASLEGETERLCQARDVLAASALAEVERYLAADEPRAALRCIEKLEGRQRTSAAVRVLRQVAQRLEAAQAAARKGKFAEAEACLAGAAALRPDLAWFQNRREQARLKAGESRGLTERLHRALAEENWSEVLAAADATLELAPESSPALAARRRAWAAVGVKTTRASANLLRARPMPLRHGASLRDDTFEMDAVMNQVRPDRFLMWIDAVGGFLVCLGDEIALGPPTQDGSADVPILADLSRRHAVIRRDGEAYLIEPLRSVKLDGRPLAGTASLVDGGMVELGEGVELRFRRPHALSGSARLEFVSHHKTEPSADAVLLMAQSCVLGPSWHSHVVCRLWQHEVILYRQGSELYCRAECPFEVNGQRCAGRSPIAPGSQVEGEDFSFSLEAV